MLRSDPLDQHPVGFLVTMWTARGQAHEQLGAGAVTVTRATGRAASSGARGAAGVAVAIGEQPVVADLDEMLRREVQLEPLNKLGAGNGLGLGPAMIDVVLVGEAHGAGCVV